MTKEAVLNHRHLDGYLKKFLEKETTVTEVVGYELIASGEPFKNSFGFRLDCCGNLIIRGLLESIRTREIRDELIFLINRGP